MKCFKDIKELYCLMENVFDDEIIQTFLSCDIEDLCLYHFSVGLWLRNNVLNDGNAIYRNFIHSGVTDKDEMSYILIENFYWYLKLKENKKNSI